MNRKKFLPMRKAIILIILFVLIIFSLCLNERTKTIPPKATKGLMDLTNWNFAKEGIVKLDGQWELYYGQLLEPKDFNNYNLSGPKDFFKLPNTFTKTVNNENLPKWGYATIRLTIKTNSTDNELYGIKTQYLLSASKIWINGELVSSSGVVSKDANNARGSFERQAAFFLNDRSNIEIVIQLSNFNNETGKIQSIYLGRDKQIGRYYITGVALDAFIIGCLFIMGLYHFTLYYKRPVFKATFYFAVFCLIVALRTLLVSERIIFYVVPDISFDLYNKLAYLTVYIGLPFIIMFFNEILENIFSSKLIALMNIISSLVTLITITTSITVYDKLLPYFELWGVLLFAYILFNIIKNTIRKTQGSLIILLGFIIFLVTVIHDILSQSGLLNSNSLAPFGLFVFIFSHSYLLATKFSNAFMTIDKLEEENKALYIDELTGILNRRGFYEQGRRLFNVAQITGGKLTLFYGDLNKLKKINDTFGHKEGDEAIKRTASLLKNSFGQDDMVAHISGDEFIAIAINEASDEIASEIIDEINNNFINYNLKSNKPYELSISIGYSLYHKNMKISFEELIHLADKKLYEIKTNNSTSDIANLVQET